MSAAPDAEPIWSPTRSRIEATLVERFRRHLGETCGADIGDFRALHRYSCDHPGPFWRELWQFAGLIGDPGDVDLESPTFASTRFFPNGTFDVAATMLAGDPDDVVVIECDESGTRARIDRAELRRLTAAMADTMRGAGVVEGDVVAAHSTTSLPTLVTMLATAACGAVFTSASAEFGADAVVARFDQVRPKVLLTVDGYTFAGRRFELADRVDEIANRLDSVELIVGPRGISFEDATAAAPDLVTTPVLFNAPGSILYSSGTTGRPKCLVHRAGGVVLKHISEMLLHCDIRRGDRVFYYTTPSWMMWNWLVSALAVGAAVVLYDGAPLAPDPRQLLALAERERVTYFGTSPSYLDAIRKSAIDVAAEFDLSAVRTIGVTGSPLAPATARAAATWTSDAHVLSKSGGTDLCGGLVTGDPTGPVWAGEIQAPALGCDIRIVDDHGADVEPGVTGELVSRTPFPSMPLCFVGDDGTRLRQAYFDRFPGCWHQADYVSETSHRGYVVHGRSDTTLNVNGVRIGTAEIYAQLERLAWIRAAAAVEHKQADVSRLVLLVELDARTELDDAAREQIRTALRTHCSPRHVPHVIESVEQLPRTSNSKLSETAVADAVNGRDVRALDSLANPGSLDAIRAIATRVTTQP